MFSTKVLKFCDFLKPNLVFISSFDFELFFKKSVKVPVRNQKSAGHPEPNPGYKYGVISYFLLSSMSTPVPAFIFLRQNRFLRPLMGKPAALRRIHAQARIFDESKKKFCMRITNIDTARCGIAHEF